MIDFRNTYDVSPTFNVVDPHPSHPSSHLKGWRRTPFQEQGGDEDTQIIHKPDVPVTYGWKVCRV
jgi:hypothetical protein